ncbi:hypothetical protein ACQ4LE_006101 [Meloidogyne hapla]|uniref:MFS domain-containing protein n=1 Tax=Meloidogyne hapla TaxID=6305 RepID=A0A1I8BIP1_MELHA
MTAKIEINSLTSNQRLLGSTRLNIAFLCFFGCAIIYSLRSNLSFAIVCMVKNEGKGNENSTNGRKIYECNNNNNGDIIIAQRHRRELLNENKISESSLNNTNFGEFNSIGGADLIIGEFDWSKQLQGQILGAFFFGYLTSQMLGGILAGRFGAKIVLFVAVLASSLISLISPAMARFHVAIFISIRALLGFTQGVIFPAMHSLLSGWAPPMERGILTGLSYAGAQVGNMLVMSLSGLLCRHGFDGGWPSIFYLFGAFGLFWCLIWFLIGADSPQTHKTIKENEREYILESLGKNKEIASPIEIKRRRPIPLYSILTSKAVWAIFIGHFAGDWGSYTMALGIPSFLNDVLGLQLTSMGIVSALPYLAYFAFINIGGHFADKLQQKGVFSTLNCRRLAMLIAFGGQALMLIAIGYCGCNQHNLVILLLILSTGISGFQYSGFVVNYMDICPELAGFVLGIGNTLSCLAGLLSPIIMGWLTPNGSKEEWLIVFYVTAFILIVGALIFSLFASAEIQEWAKEDFNYSSNKENEEEKQQKIIQNSQKLPLLENDITTELVLQQRNDWESERKEEKK